MRYWMHVHSPLSPAFHTLTRPSSVLVVRRVPVTFHDTRHTLMSHRRREGEKGVVREKGDGTIERRVYGLC